MRFSTVTLALAPVALAAPFKLPELSNVQWGSIQEHIGGLGRWGWSTGAEVAESILGGDDTQKSIWQQLQDDDNYKRLVKILKFEDSVYKDLDKTDDGYDITFFAPNDEALKPPKHHHDDDDDDGLASLSFIATSLEAEPWLMNKDKGGKDKDKERRKKIFKKIAHAVLKYHILPQGHTAGELAQNSTMATTLKPHDGSSDGLARRIHIQKKLLPPSLMINHWAKVVKSNEARNGKWHEIDHPLLPPGSVFEEMFIMSKYLSITTSAIQRVHARKYVDWEYDHHASKPGKPKFKGNPLITMFAPSNEAWEQLPEKLRFYLFSRFGQDALAKVLAYHAVPRTLLLSEIVHEAKKGKDKKVASIAADDPSFHREFEVHSAFKNAKLKIVADKTKVIPVEGAVKTTMKVNDEEVKVLDIPASNGAWHIIDKVLCPPHKHKDHDDDFAEEDPWANWQEWLPAWAAESDHIDF